MSNTVLPRARHNKIERASAVASKPQPVTGARCTRRKSSAAVKCPTCGSPLVVEKDTPDRTTLRCPRCSRRTPEWVAGPDAHRAVRTLARKYKGLALGDVDDLTQDVVLAVLEAGVAPADEGQFAEWLDALAKRVAGGTRDAVLAQPRAIDGEVLQAVASREECELDTLEAWEAKEKADKARAARVRRVLAKLPDAQRRAVKDKFFGTGNLAASARDGGKCDSAERMNLLRAKKKLVSLIDAAGYSLAA